MKGRKPSIKAESVAKPSATNPLGTFKQYKDGTRVSVLDKYEIAGYIAAGTYGRVFKARSKDSRVEDEYAIKKFKSEKENEVPQYFGISQSACREMALCRELHHENLTNLTEIILEDMSIYMVFDYAEHDLLQIIQYNSYTLRMPISEGIIMSVLWQLLNGVCYLHENWVMHRDLKPANIMVTSGGVVKIGDLGLARVFYRPLQPLFTADKVVVTIWYRAPELLLGARHYTPAIDLWAVGCIYAELLSLRPIFKGEEIKMDNKKTVPFQRNQMQKIFEVLGSPIDEWPEVAQFPEFQAMQTLKTYRSNLDGWYRKAGGTNMRGYQLLAALLKYNPDQRITALDALNHRYFTEATNLSGNAFEGQDVIYPSRRITNDDTDIKTNAPPKRSGGSSGFYARKRARN
ncbi:hypothetical protein CANCADRAFT_147630 [Tortispora caseinolytica NRRL Y-17796]|uniref:Cyclin-dependent kinase 8 n=1 Tax=Tortispora caseinolytica NRRL Y-17796 TaxID=767744 RepID=A0A1E4TLJ8_9ASCO|nr:hypothetical protein CANCADRAFT_147630 [Tortispora caseinolytica NRRL Y-17796]